MFEKIKSLTNSFLKSKSPTQATAPSQVAPNTYLDTGYLLSMNRLGSYDNNFSAISRIAETFAEVEPYAVDANGDKLVVQPPLIEVLKNPTQEMSGTDFAEALITMLLVHPTVFLLVWRSEAGNSDPVPGGQGLTADNIAGFTFLEDASRVKLDGKIHYRTQNGKIWTTQDVLTFSLNVNPYSLTNGYSPTMAAKKWSNVDDYVADYQAGYFKNGALPAGQMVVTAPSIDAFNETVDRLQAQHRGASNANNITYVHRPTSQIDGKPLAASIEWIPFTQPTKDSTLQSIFDQANKKIETTFGVPAEVKGYLQNSNYASVETANYIFERYVVYPKLTKVWTRFTHELNRMTGGLGYAISFDYELPVLTDALTSQVNSLNSLLGQGFTVESSVKALGLPSSFLELEKEETPEPEPETTEEAFTSDEAAAENTEVVTVERSYKPKAPGNDVDAQDEATVVTDPELKSIIQNYNASIISEVIRRYLKGEPITATDLSEWLETSGLKDNVTDLVTTILLAIMQTNGQEALGEFAKELGLEDMTFSVPAETEQDMRERIADLIQSYGEQTIDELLARIDVASQSPDATQEQVRQQLQEINALDAYRVDRWAASEQHYHTEIAILVAASIASQRTDLTPYKTWRINPLSPDICANCIAMNGETVPLDQLFSNGNMVPAFHPHCYCTMEITFRPAMKSVKVTCPKCGRYICESTGGDIKGVICSNSKCKRKFDIIVANGKIKAVEVAKS